MPRLHVCLWIWHLDAFVSHLRPSLGVFAVDVLPDIISFLTCDSSELFKIYLCLGNACVPTGYLD